MLRSGSHVHVSNADDGHGIGSDDDIGDALRNPNCRPDWEASGPGCIENLFLGEVKVLSATTCVAELHNSTDTSKNPDEVRAEVVAAVHAWYKAQDETELQQNLSNSINASLGECTTSSRPLRTERRRRSVSRRRRSRLWEIDGEVSAKVISQKDVVSVTNLLVVGVGMMVAALAGVSLVCRSRRASSANEDAVLE